jgi:multisite-specific tRNA:(cytosine-C5)-methyltransferase
VRNPAGNAVRSLYITNGLVKAIVQHNDYNRMRLTACGTKVFMKQDGGKGTEAHFRVLAEGLSAVLPHMNPDAIIEVDIDALTTFLKTQYPLCVSFKEPIKTLLANKGKLFSNILRSFF